MTIKRSPSSFRSIVWFSILLTGRLAASIEFDAGIPQLAFAAQELNAALSETGRQDLQVVLAVQPDKTSPEAYRIRVSGPNRIEVTGTDGDQEPGRRRARE